MHSCFNKAFVALLFLVCAVSMVPAQTRFDLGSLPLWFEAGQGGQTGQFIARGRDSRITILPDGAEFTLGRPGQKPATARMDFLGACEAAVLSGSAEMPARINYLSGNDPSQWQTGVTAFGQVRVAGLYPGINLVYYGNQQRLEYDFDLAPGAQPGAVMVRFDGAQKLLVNSQGELVVELAGRQVVQHQPMAYQTVGGSRQSVAVGYKMVDPRTVTFSVGHYDSRLPLVIDPVLSYSTFFGGNNADVAWAVVFATNDDSVYIAGQTLSTNISSTVPFATPGAFQSSFHGGGSSGDAFVAKFHDLTSPSQLTNLSASLIYCTYIGGSSDDTAQALAVDAAGHAFIAGTTLSQNFPVKNALVYPGYNGANISGSPDKSENNQYPGDGFVTELETNGASLIYSTYLGGESYDAIYGLALDANDDAYLTGYTCSEHFPVTNQSHFASVYRFYYGYNAFVSEIAAGGKNLIYSTYLGGTNADVGVAVACNNQFVAVVGYTYSSNFPTVNAISQYLSVSNDYNGALLNGSYNNVNNNLVNAPFTSDAFVTLYPIVQTNSIYTLGAPVYSTLLGGSNADEACAVAFDSQTNVYVVGATLSPNFPVTSNTNQLLLPSYLLQNPGGPFFNNVFLTQLIYEGATNPPMSGYSDVFGGSGNDIGQGVALDAAGNVFITGSTTSTNNTFATTNNLVGGLTYTNAGQMNVFVAAFQAGFSNLLYAADFGSSNQDAGYGIAVGPDDSVYIVGQTYGTSSAYLGFPLLNAWEPVAPDQNNGFLTKILPHLPSPPALAINQAGSNVLVSWTASPLAEFNINSLALQVNSNLLVGAVLTNYVVSGMMTNTVVVTNLVPASNWVNVTESPIVTNLFVNGYTNILYQYPFPATNSMQFFRLRSFTY
jgi:hypothetical protein